jgi:hypothetical protein
MKDLESIFEEDTITTREEEEMDSIQELKDYVEENSHIDFVGTNNLSSSNIMIRKQVAANSRFKVGSFAKLAELVSEKSGIRVNQRQVAASWYYILYQLFYK